MPRETLVKGLLAPWRRGSRFLMLEIYQYITPLKKRSRLAGEQKSSFIQRFPDAPALLALALALALAPGCGGRRTPPPGAEPPEGYLRRLVLVLERADYRPAAGTPVLIETAPPAQLVSPAEGRGLTDAQGRLELVFAPRPEPNAAARAGGDVIVDYPVQAVLTLPGGRTLNLDDRETYARYADSAYQGLNRDPEAKPTYYVINLGNGD